MELLIYVRHLENFGTKRAIQRVNWAVSHFIQIIVYKYFELLKHLEDIKHKEIQRLEGDKIFKVISSGKLFIQ